MADYDEDELFADLYGDDAPPPKAVSEAAPTNPQPEPIHAPEPQENEPVADVKETVEQNSYQNNGDGGTGYGNNDQMQEYGGEAQGNYGDTQSNDNDGGGPVGIKEDGKMFIGGLNWETTDESLKNYFSQFGKVLECTVMRDGATGRSRGFGFLTFDDPKTVNTVMVKEHYLDGKIIDPKRAIPREEQERTSKIFVGGVHHDATEEIFSNYFRQFGRVIDATLMMDKETGHPRGFGFVTFDGEEAVEKALSMPLNILGKPIEVKRAEPRGNVQDDNRGGRFGRNKFDKFNRHDGQGGDMNGGGPGQMQMPGGQNDMSPSLMAKYWFMMNQYFTSMQQQLAGQMRGGQGGPMAGGMMNPMMAAQMQGMNPAMMQQMMQQQGMNPAMMQQMMQQQQMMGQGGGMGGGPGGPRGNGFGAEQNAYEQQKYERQQPSRGQGGSPWDGGYEDGTGSAGAPAGPRGGAGGPIRQHGPGSHRGGMSNSATPPAGPSAPVNAPTGPKNAGKPGANFRGGRGGGGRGGGRFNPY